MQIFFVFSLLLSAIVTFFAVLNPDVVTIKLFWVNYELSQSMVILASTAIGAIITIFLGLFSKIKTSLKIKDLNNELGSAKQKIELLNNSIKDYEQKVNTIQNENSKTEKVNTESVTYP